MKSFYHLYCKSISRLFAYKLLSFSLLYLLSTAFKKIQNGSCLLRKYVICLTLKCF